MATGPLASDDIGREPMHHRKIDLQFFRRADGFYEVLGQLHDRKHHAYRRVLADEDTPAGATVHDIAVRVVIDDTFLVHDAAAYMRSTPFEVCKGVTETLAPLKGLRMSGGWNKKVRDLLGGAASCTHVVELLGPMATTAYQGLAPKRLAVINNPENEAMRVARVDSCYAYSGERAVVARLWPHLHRPGKSEGT